MVEANRSTARFQWIKSFWMIVSCMIAGIAAGMLWPAMALSVAGFGNLYLSFLKMCVIPIMMTAIISSIGNLLMNSGAMHTIKRMLLVYCCALVAVSGIGILTGMVIRPGAGLTSESRSALGSAVGQSIQDGAQQSAGYEHGLLDFLLGMIPANIFHALLDNNTLQILFFSIIVGVAVGVIRTKPGEELIQIADMLFQAFQRAIAWSMYILPLGLFCIMAGQFATMNVGILPALLKLVLALYGASLVIIMLSALIMAIRLRTSVATILRAMKDTLAIAFGTRNSIATIPSCIKALSGQLGISLSTVKLSVPLGIVLCRYSMVLVYTLGIVFTAQLYGFEFGFAQWGIVLLGAVMASVAGAGSPAMVSIGMIAIIAGPLQLPVDVTIILLLAINPIVDPIITSASVVANCAAATLIAPRKNADVHMQEIGTAGLDPVQ